MNYLLKGAGFSFLVHAAVLLVFIGLNTSMARFTRPVLIDFSVEDSPAKGDAKAPPGRKKREVKNRTVAAAKPEPPKPRPAVAKQETAPRESVEERAAATSKTSPELQAPASGEPAAKTTPSSGSTAAAGGIAETEGVGPQSGGRGSSPEGLRQGYLKEHFAYIRNIVQRKLHYPKIARKMGWEGRVVISFIVCRDGNARDIVVREGSGFELLDRNAVAAVQTASPFPRPPVEAQLVIPITYTLN